MSHKTPTELIGELVLATIADVIRGAGVKRSEKFDAARAALLARLAPLVWTKALTEKPDYYWARVVHTNSGKTRDLGPRMVDAKSWQTSLQGTHYEFAGPIPSPVEGV